MENLISIPFIAVLLGLFAADYFFVEKYRKVIDAIKQETIQQKVSPALRDLMDGLISDAREGLTDANSINDFVLNLRNKLEEVEFAKLFNLNQKIFDATEILRKTQTIFDKYLDAGKKTMVLSLILSIFTFLPLLCRYFIQEYIGNNPTLLTKIYYIVFIFLFIIWAYYLLVCIITRCNLSKSWKNYV